MIKRRNGRTGQRNPPVRGQPVFSTTGGPMEWLHFEKAKRILNRFHLINIGISGIRAFFLLMLGVEVV